MLKSVWAALYIYKDQAGVKILVCNLIKPDQTEQLGPHRLLMMNMVDFVERVCVVDMAMARLLGQGEHGRHGAHGCHGEQIGHV